MSPSSSRIPIAPWAALSATAGLFFLAGADFAGAMQLMIYVGGTLVLLIFVVAMYVVSALVNNLTASVYDPNSGTPEYKGFLVNLEKA